MKHLRLSLGHVEAATLQAALSYMLDTWRDGDPESDTPDDRDLIRRLRALDEHVSREKVRQGLVRKR